MIGWIFGESITFKADHSDVLLPVKPVSSSSRLPIGAKGNISSSSPPWGKPFCTIESRETSFPHLFFGFLHVKIPLGPDKTANPAAVTLTLAATLRLVVASSSSSQSSVLHGSLQHLSPAFGTTKMTIIGPNTDWKLFGLEHFKMD